MDDVLLCSGPDRYGPCMNGSFPRAGRRFSVGLAILGFLVVGCTADDDADAGNSEPAATDSVTAASADDPAVEIETVFAAYWDAVVQAQSGQAADPAALFSDIAVDETIEENVGVATRYEQQGLVRVGEPVISDVSIDVDGRSATVTACVDESDWLAEVGGQILPPRDGQLEPYPVQFEVVRTGGAWLVGESVEPGGEITC